MKSHNAIHRNSRAPFAWPPRQCGVYSPPPACFLPLSRFSMNKERLIPLIVATALFMENMDSTVIATSLPAIAADIGREPPDAETCHHLVSAVAGGKFIPASGWTADRFGARMVFSIAIGVFIVGSIGCALSSSVNDFVSPASCRVLAVR